MSMTHSGKSKWQDKMPKWSNPPTAKQKRTYFGKSLIDLYCDLFNRKVKRQPHFAELTLHVIIGQLPSVKKLRIYSGDNVIDLRISGCFFKPSGSGGGRGLNFMSRICRALEIIAQIITEITDAALIGTTETEKVYNPEKKGMEVINRIERGALDPTVEDGHRVVDIVVMNEADILFSGAMSEFKKNAMLYYQIALNPMGTEDNKLAKKLSRGEWVEFNPECSLFFMSYPPDSFYETIVKRGFLQRMVIIFNIFSTQDRIAVSKELTSMLNTKRTPESEYNDVIRRLAAVNQFWAGKEEVEIKIDPKAKKVLNRLVDEIFVPFDGIADYPRQKLEEFTQRWIEHAWKIAWHHMILRMDTTITLEDVGYAKNYIIPLWKELIGVLEEGISAPREHDRAHKQYVTEAVKLYQSTCKKAKLDKGTPISRAKFIKTLATSDFWSVSGKTASQRIRRMEDEGLFERTYRGTAPMIALKKLPKWLKNRKS